MPLVPIAIMRNAGTYEVPVLVSGFVGLITYDWSAKDISAAGPYTINRDDATTGGGLASAFAPRVYWYKTPSPPQNTKFFRDTYIFFGESGVPGPITFDDDYTLFFWLTSSDWDENSQFPPEQIPDYGGGAFDLTIKLYRFLLSGGYSAAYAWNSPPPRIGGTKTLVDSWIIGPSYPGMKDPLGEVDVHMRPGYWLDVEDGDTIGGIEWAWELEFSKAASGPEGPNNNQQLFLASADGGPGYLGTPPTSWSGETPVENTWGKGQPPPPFWDMAERLWPT